LRYAGALVADPSTSSTASNLLVEANLVVSYARYITMHPRISCSARLQPLVNAAAVSGHFSASAVLLDSPDCSLEPLTSTPMMSWPSTWRSDSLPASSRSTAPPGPARARPSPCCCRSCRVRRRLRASYLLGACTLSRRTRRDNHPPTTLIEI
jgi:hypothetical protein